MKCKLWGVALSAMLFGCGGTPLDTHVWAKVGKVQSTYNAGLCTFSTEATTHDQQWLDGEPVVSWTDTCGAFRIGDTVWLRVVRAQQAKGE